MTTKTSGWTYSFDNCDFSNGMFEKKKDALIDAQREGRLRNQENDERNRVIFLATAEAATNEQFFPGADLITESMACQAEDVGGDYANDYPDVSKEAESELTNALNNLLSDWCKRHEIAPSFYSVGESTKYDISTLKPIK